MNCIEIYDNVLSKKECERLIHLFDNSPLKSEGVAGGRVNHSAKQSIALDLSFGRIDKERADHPDNKEVNEIFKALSHVAKILKISNLQGGYRTLSNISINGGQEVPHLHFNLFGGEKVGKMVE